MSEPKFMPGPWRVEVLGKDCLSVIIYADKGRPIASLYHERYKLSEQRANAALIAAAPEMYEMLDKLQKWLIRNADNMAYHDPQSAANMRKAAGCIANLLTKARGES